MKETNSKELWRYGVSIPTYYTPIQITEILPDFIADVDTNN